MCIRDSFTSIQYQLARIYHLYLPRCRLPADQLARRLHVGQNSVSYLLLKHLLLKVFVLHLSNCLVLRLFLVLETISEFEVGSLVELRQTSVHLKEQLNVAKNVEISQFFKSIFKLSQEALRNFVLSVHVLEPDIEEYQAAEHDCQFI